MSEQDGFLNEKTTMLDVHLRRRGITDSRVLDTMAAVPREKFVPAEYRSRAYSDGPLPIGLDQTISQPYIVALMTQELGVDADCEVLEIGTGCGYQTAVLSRLVKKVYTIERLAELSASAQRVLADIGVDNVEFAVGDGSFGWPDQRTFDRIIITAAVPNIPQTITEQLAEGALLVAPVGPAGVQQLIAATQRKGTLIEKHICGCRFVKLIGEHGFDG